MSTLVEIENAIASLSVPELTALERSVRNARQRKLKPKRQSALDLPPLDLGEVLRPLTPEDDLLDEMLDDSRL